MKKQSILLALSLMCVTPLLFAKDGEFKQKMKDAADRANVFKERTFELESNNGSVRTVSNRKKMAPMAVAYGKRAKDETKIESVEIDINEISEEFPEGGSADVLAAAFAAKPENLPETVEVTGPNPFVEEPATEENGEALKHRDVELDRRLHLMWMTNKSKLDFETFKKEQLSKKRGLKPYPKSVLKKEEVVADNSSEELMAPPATEVIEGGKTRDFALDRRLEAAKKTNAAVLEFKKLGDKYTTKSESPEETVVTNEEIKDPNYIEEKLIAAETQVDEINKSLEEMRTENPDNSKLLKLVEDLKGDLQKHKDEISALKSELSAKNDLLAEMLEKEKSEGSSQELSDEISCLREELIALEAKYFELNSKQESFVAQYDELKVDVNVEITETETPAADEPTVVATDDVVKKESVVEEKKEKDCLECSVAANFKSMFGGNMSMTSVFSALQSGIQTALYTQQIFDTWLQYELRKTMLMPSSLYLGEKSDAANNSFANNDHPMGLNVISPLSLMQNFGLINSGSINNNYYYNKNAQNDGVGNLQKNFETTDWRQFSKPNATTASATENGNFNMNRFNFSNPLVSANVNSSSDNTSSPWWD